MSLSGQRIELASTPDFQLGKLLISPSACRISADGAEYRVEPKVMEVLIVLTRAAGRTVTRDDLIEACWDGRAVSDDAVSRVIAKVRQVGRGAEPPHFTLETLPKVGFRMEVAAAPAPTMEQPSLERQAAAPAQTSPAAFALAQRLWVIAAGMGLVAVLAGLTWLLSAPQPAWSGRSKVGVAAFKALGPAPELSRISANAREAMFLALTDAGANAVMMQDGASPAEATDSLTIAGTVDRVADTFRLTTAISDQASGRVIWSQAFERDATDAQGIPGEAAHDTAQALQCAIREGNTSAQAISLDVFALLLRACSGDVSEREEQRAVEVTQRLVQQAGELAASHAFRALALTWRATRIDHLSDDVQSLKAEARAAAERAITLDPKSVAANLAMDAVLEPTTEFGAREYHLRRALSLAPEDPQALAAYGRFLRQVGRVGAAREVYRRVETRAGPVMQAIILSAMEGDVLDTKRLQSILAGIRPSWARASEGMISVFWEDPAAVLSKLEQSSADMRLPKPSCMRPYLETLAKRTKQAGLPTDCADVTFDWRARMLGRLGEVDAVFSILEQPMPNSRQTTVFLFYPEMKAVRHDRRFMPLAERRGLLAYWRTSNQWPDFCAASDLPYDCKTWQAASND